MRPSSKWRFGIGTTSRVPQSKLHYFIADFDGPIPHKTVVEWMLSNFPSTTEVIRQKTHHGWHIYTDWKMTFTKLVQTLKLIGADPSWIRIGEKRGYFFLADKAEIQFPWPVEHMVIHHGKKKT